MSHQSVTHLFHLSVNGGEKHRFAILLAAEIAAGKGWKVHDMTAYTQAPFRPDLIISKRDKMLAGPHRSDKTITFWLDVVDSHDPRTDWRKKNLPCDDVLIVDISGLTLDDIADAIRRTIP